jgi:transcription-repair coupling factor (superfamily II helicase)
MATMAPPAPLERAELDLSALLWPALHHQRVGDAVAGKLARFSIADAAKPFALAAMQAASGRTVALVTARPGHARELWEELCAWSGSDSRTLMFPAVDALPYETLPEDPFITAERVRVLSALADGTPLLLVIPLRAVIDAVEPPERFRAESRRIRVGDRFRPAELAELWTHTGYEHTVLVDGPGQFSRRGGILDVYPAGGEPTRIEFFGDEIESIRRFDLESQRSADRIDEVVVVPAHDSTDDLTSAACTIIDHLPADALVVVDEPPSVVAAARELERQAEELRLQLESHDDASSRAHRPYIPWDNVSAALRHGERQLLELIHDPENESIDVVHAEAFGGRLRPFLQRLAQPSSHGEHVVIVSQQTARLQELLGERGVEVVPSARAAVGPWSVPGLYLVHGSLNEGWRSATLGMAVYTDSELFGWRKVRRQVRRGRAAARDAFVSDLEPGEMVVHVDHGIARYHGLFRAESGDAPVREYLQLEYANGDRLYVPVEQADRVSRYVGGGEERPSLTRLGSQEWQRAKSRARRAVRDIANDLIELYATRQTVDGRASSPDAPWQRELEDSFPFVETPDQIVAIEEVKRDMERPVPMDRVLVGDVGYGKTEVSLRAAFKAVMDGCQVAVLVPTTVLAQQHHTTFTERFASYPVRVEMLSRFRSPPEQRQVVKGLSDGSVDVCIGTHRLLSNDVRFKNLGLVVIDEEQRFGVTHKERLKQLRKEVDVLTMTATPIPRTLHMSLSGVRDMSVIQTPPEQRLPIRTYVAEYDEQLLREVLLRELDRNGQVYFVHNRVQSIEVVASRLRRLVPEARFLVGHGQMPEEQLERVMLDFANGLADVLLCTTIIESGLDIPNVNTIIVNNAHRFGLAQLYQLRGRVGRGTQRAYAYLLFARDTQLTEHAEQRLRTIFEATELGAGFRIAMKDLEIRGAGNLLGAEQSGHIAAVGFDLYSRLLGEAVETIRAVDRGEAPPVRDAASADERPSVDLPLEAFIPGSYVADEATRLNLYQRLATVREQRNIGPFMDELEDRFGAAPEPVQNLLFLIGLRLQAVRAGIAHISTTEVDIVVRLRGTPDPGVAGWGGELGAPISLGSNQIRFRRGSGTGWLPRLQWLVDRLAGDDGTGLE